ncbi:hypothetical protein GE09DRAFT_1217944 [Coniochaeta sp. 2T2.1]|nr:hypothetical protein GE09DRAFT_1217944 [Coniochaeta sp. 2T2.1]
MTSNTRETRASRSRFSSPQVSAQAPNGTTEQPSSSSKGQATGLDKQKAFMAGWLEPPVTVKPSYQDAGLMRHGVVEGMAPLGTLPKVGIFKKTAAPAASGDTPPQQTPPPTRIVLKRPANTTPRPPPAPITPAAQTEDDTEEVDDDETSTDDDDEAEGLIAPPPLPTSRRRSLRIEEDGGFSPAGLRAGSVGTRGVNTRSRRSISRASAGPDGTAFQTSPSKQQTQTSASSMSRVMNSVRDVADKVMRAAIREAVEHYRYPTAWALTVLHKENSGNDEFSTMVQEVFTQTATAETSARFNRMLAAKKKEGKKGNRGYLYFVPPAVGAAIGPQKPLPAPYGAYLRRKVAQVSTDREQTTSERGQEPEPAPAPAPSPATQPALVAAPEQPAQETAQEATQETAQEPAQEEPLEIAQDPSQQQQGSPQKKRKKLPDEPRPSVEETLSKKRRTSPNKASESATPVTTKIIIKSMASNGKSKSANGGTPATGNGKAKLTESPSMRRKERAVSVASDASSSSSLSSARSLTPPDGIMDSDEDMDVEMADVPDVPPSRTSPAAETSDSARSAKSANAPTAPQPIARPRRNNAPKKKRNVSPTTPGLSSPAIIPAATTNNNTTTTTRSQQQSAAAAAAASSMPALIEPPVFPNLPPPKKSAYKAAGAHHDKGVPVFASRVGKLDENDVKIRLRLKAKSVTNSCPLPESFNRYESDEDERERSTQRPRLKEAAATGGDAAASSSKPSRVSGAATVFTEAVNGNLNAASRSTRSSRKRSHDEVDDGVSPTNMQFPPGALDDASTPATSRAQTPILRPAKKAKTGARVKQSPMKKKSGTSAGIPRPSGERSSPAPNGAVQDENDDYCSSCGGNGELLCCDGCTRAFHLICVDPPLFEDRMPADWFCNVCLKARNAFGRHSGAFKELLERLDPKNSSAFRLPLAIRDYFEGMRTGVDGEYEDIVTVQKPQNSRKKKVEEEVPDFFRLRDNEGNAILCHQCDKPTADDRAIIPCSVCSLWWHIDCLDPPLAQPPVLRTWVCPTHSEDLLNKLPGARGPAHRHRKVKGAEAITPIYSRGNTNNGYIEVIDDLSESEDESGYKDRNTFGKVQRLSGKGLLRDFAYKVRKNRKGKPIAPLAAAVPPPTPQVVVDPLSLDKLQAAQNLAQLSGQGNAGVSTLVDTLLANAPPSVISLMARGNASHLQGASKLNQADTQSLRAMLAMFETMTKSARDLLARGGELPSPATPAGDSQHRLERSTRGSSSRSSLRIATSSPADPTVFPGSKSASTAQLKAKELPSPPATDLPDKEGDTIVAVDTEIKDEDE